MTTQPAPLFHPRMEHAGGPDALAEGSYPHNWADHVPTQLLVNTVGAHFSSARPQKPELPEGITSITEVDAVYSEWAGGTPYIRGTKETYQVAGSKESFNDLKAAMAAASSLSQLAVSGRSFSDPSQQLTR